MNGCRRPARADHGVVAIRVEAGGRSRAGEITHTAVRVSRGRSRHLEDLAISPSGGCDDCDHRRRRSLSSPPNVPLRPTVKVAEGEGLLNLGCAPRSTSRRASTFDLRSGRVGPGMGTRRHRCACSAWSSDGCVQTPGHIACIGTRTSSGRVSKSLVVAWDAGPVALDELTSGSEAEH